MKTETAKHTEPWKLELYLGHNNCYVYIMEDTQGGETEEEANANLALMNLAPRMLEALELIQKHGATRVQHLITAILSEAGEVKP